MISISKFNVHIVYQGDAYGLRDCLTHDNQTPLIEFYDGRYVTTDNPRGQFIGRYNAGTLINDETDLSKRGLCLQGDAPEWNVQPAEMVDVFNYLHDELDAMTCGRCHAVSVEVQRRYSFGIYAGKLCVSCCSGFRDNCGVDQPQGNPYTELDEQIDADY